MKKLLILGLVLSSAMTYAQSAKVVSAYNYNQKGELDKAWQNIEEATQDPKTGIDAKTWKYRFDILSNIFAALQDPKAPIEYRSLLKVDQIPVELKKSYEKTKEYDTKNRFIEDIQKDVKLKAAIMNNMAIASYDAAAKGFVAFKDTLTTYNMIDGDKVREEAVTANLEVLKAKATKMDKSFSIDINKCLDASKADLLNCLNKKASEKYTMAFFGFAQCASMLDMIGTTDSNAIYSAAVCAELAGLKKEAAEVYKECIKIKFNGAISYNSIVRIYRDLKMNEEMINIIKQGRAEYPSDESLLISELNHYIETGNNVETEKLLKVAIEKNPTNYNLFYVLGVTYDNLANPKDKDGKDLPKPANYEAMVNQAKTSYKKALEIKPDYFDALYNYGALLFNDGVEYNNKANNLDYKSKKAEIDVLNKKAEEKFKESIPVFEKAMAISPSDKSVLLSLKQLYVRLEMTDKYNEVKKKLEALK